MERRREGWRGGEIGERSGGRGEDREPGRAIKEERNAIHQLNKFTLSSLTREECGF